MFPRNNLRYVRNGLRAQFTIYTSPLCSALYNWYPLCRSITRAASAARTCSCWPGGRWSACGRSVTGYCHTFWMDKSFLCAQNIKKLCQVCPAQMEMDGLLNLWIIKPGCSSRGRGITISNRLERILGIVEHGAGAKQAR